MESAATTTQDLAVSCHFPSWPAMSFLEGSLICERHRCVGSFGTAKWPAMSGLPNSASATHGLLPCLSQQTYGSVHGLPCLLFCPCCRLHHSSCPGCSGPAMSALSPGLLRAFSACRPAMSLIFVDTILCNAMFYPAEMACHVSSPVSLSSRLLILQLAFAPGCHVCEGLPCLYIAHFECDKESNDLLTGGVPCPPARLDAGASCAVRPWLRAARQVW